jgi:putative tryptophan/tyrosine transport system substrate-binding protein
MRRRDFISGIVVSAAASPLAGRAQQVGKIPTVGVQWHAGSAEEERPYLNALLEGFKNLDYVEGRNIKFEHRFPNEMPERFEAMTAELASLKVDVLVAIGTTASVNAKKATTTIPIVFTVVGDPVGSKLVDSFARPGRNVTGITTFAPEVVGRRLQILKELVPGLSRVAQLANPNALAMRANLELVRAAAAVLGLSIQPFEARSLDELKPAFDAMRSAGMQAALISANEGLPFQGRVAIAQLALERRLALCAFSRETFEPGALMSYGTDQPSLFHRAAFYADKILKGARPADMPVEGPTKFEFLLNLKTAKALGLDPSGILLGRADEVIE